MKDKKNRNKNSAFSFGAGVLAGALLFGGVGVAAAGVLATPTEELDQRITLDGKPVELTGYNINGNNYFMLRDVAAAVDFGVTWDGATKTVAIDTTTGYEHEGAAEDIQPEADTPPEEEAPAEVDYSQNANPAAFTDVYTREVYNALYQFMLDGGQRPFHVADEQALQELNEMAAKLGTYPSYWITANMDGAGACRVSHAPSYAAAAEKSDAFLASLAGLAEREKIEQMAWYVCDRLMYSTERAATPGEVLSSDKVQKGTCMSYAHSFMFLCQRAGIPCIFMNGD